MNVPALDGEKYFAVARDVKTGLFDGFGLELMSDMPRLTIKLGERIRKQYGLDHPHLLFQNALRGVALCDGLRRGL
jgi:hypothetical protein